MYLILQIKCLNLISLFFSLLTKMFSKEVKASVFTCHETRHGLEL